MLLFCAAALAKAPTFLPEDGAVVGSTVSFAVPSEEDVTILIQEAIGDAEPFRIVALPDTQFLTTEENLLANGDVFASQTQWIADNSDGIAFVTHLGDIIQDWDDTEQWAVADAAMSLLDDEIPYGLVVGNHDYPAQYPEKADQELFNTYFSTDRFDKQPWWGDGFPKGTNNNSYQVFSAGVLDFLILHLRFEPDADVRAWASGVIADHPNHRVIISTHTNLGPDGEYWVIPSYNPGETTWTDLIEPHDNVFMVLSAHLNGEARRTDTVGDRSVHQLLSCYQEEADGGAGTMRLMDFYPEDNRIEVSTYSPWLDEWQEDEDSQFALDYPMGGLEVAGVAVADKGVATLSWESPRAGEYFWVIEDGAGERTDGGFFSVDGDGPVISEVEVFGRATDSVAQVAWLTNELSFGTILVNGDSVAVEKKPSFKHLVDISVVGETFLLQIIAVDEHGNTSSTEETEINLYNGEDPDTDSGDTDIPPDDTATDTDSADDTGQPPDEPGCGGCAAGPGAPSGFFLSGFFLWVFFRRAATSGSSSER